MSVLSSRQLRKSNNKAVAAQQEGSRLALESQERMYNRSRDDLAGQRDIGNQALDQLGGLYGIKRKLTADDIGELSDEQIQKFYTAPDNSDLVSLQEGYEPRRGVGFAGMGKRVDRKGDQEKVKQREEEAMASARKQAMDSAIQERTASDAAQDQGDPYAQFRESPDYKFALEQGQRATNQSLAARGLSNSGAALKELTNYGQGVASQQLGNYKNQLMSLAGIGQTATNVGVGVNQNYGNNQSNLQVQNANNIAQGAINDGQIKADAIGTAISTAATAATGGFGGMGGMGGMASAGGSMAGSQLGNIGVPERFRIGNQ
jgi:hypothetical protein